MGGIEGGAAKVSKEKHTNTFQKVTPPHPPEAYHNTRRKMHLLIAGWVEGDSNIFVTIPPSNHKLNTSVLPCVRAPWKALVSRRCFMSVLPPAMCFSQGTSPLASVARGFAPGDEVQTGGVQKQKERTGRWLVKVSEENIKFEERLVPTRTLARRARGGTERDGGGQSTQQKKSKAPSNRTL